MHGEFVDYSETIIQHIKAKKLGERAIFVLDQCGYIGVPLPTINRILSCLKNAEVILTFAVDSLIDYLSDREHTQEALEKIGIDLDGKQIQTFKQQRDSRFLIQRHLIKEIWEGSGAKYFTPFFIRSKDSHRDLWLIHLSGHAKARDEMVSVHWKNNTSFAHYGRSGMNMLGYDPDEDQNVTKQKILPQFSFDETALISTSESLFEEFPELLSKHKEGICFKDFFSSITNESPATREIMASVLANLARLGVINVRDEKGAVRRRESIRNTDIIFPLKHRTIFLPLE